MIIQNSYSSVVLFHFINGDSADIPDLLTMRPKTFTLLMMGILAISFLLLTIARVRNAKAIQTVFSTFFKNASIEQTLRENMRMESISSVLLILNYFVSFSLCLFILFHRLLLIDWFWSVISAIAFPIGLFILETAGLFITGMLTGEMKKLTSSIIVTLTASQFTGIILTLLSLFWILNPEFNFLFAILFISVIGIKYLTRLLKISFTVLINRVPWYYIILYFCTLEILPLFVAYYYVLKNFLV